MKKTYSELIRLNTFEERFEYLRLKSYLDPNYFGLDRYFKRFLYDSREWKNVRNKIMLRDDGCDLGMPDRKIFSRLTVHHINPISIEDIEEGSPLVFDLENLISASHETHNAIHLGNADMLIDLPKPRTKGDTTLWRTQVY